MKGKGMDKRVKKEILEIFRKMGKNRRLRIIPVRRPDYPCKVEYTRKGIKIWTLH